MLYHCSAFVFADMIGDMESFDRYLCIGGKRIKSMIGNRINLLFKLNCIFIFRFDIVRLLSAIEAEKNVLGHPFVALTFFKKVK